MQVIDGLDGLSGGEFLDHVALLGVTQRRAEVDIVRAAWQWAIRNNADVLDPEVSKLPGRERARRFGGCGTPEVAEFAVAEFGARLGMSTWAGGELVGDAVDLNIRFPLLWARVEQGEVRVSYARFVTKKCRQLTLEQAGYVDTRVATYADGRVTWTRFEVLVAAAIRAADPVAAAEREAKAAGHKFAKATRSSEDGMRGFYIRASCLVIAQLDATVSYIAEALRQLGDGDDLDGRRVKAVLIIANPVAKDEFVAAYQAWKDRPADPDMPADQDEPPAPGEDESPAPGEDGDKAGAGTGERPLLDWARLFPTAVVFVHLYGERDTEQIARVEGVGPVTEAWIRHHLGPHAQVKVLPVLDLAGQAPVDAYEVPDRHRQAVHLMTPADIFPFSSSTSRGMQIDHTDAYLHGAPDPASEDEADGEPPGGQSRIGNYGPMTLFHHRIKTHGRWQVKQPFPGIYVWRDPHGAFYLVDHTGTRRIQAPAREDATASRLEAHFSDIILAA